MRYYFLTILVSMVAIAAFSQVSMDNEDGVAKIDAMRARNDFVPGQVLVKFCDANRVTLSRSRGMVTTNLSRVSNVLSKYGVGEMEQLLPNENPKRQLRKSRAFNGETIQERDLSQLYLISLSDDHAEETIQMIEELNALEEVEFAEPNYRVYTLADDNIAADYSSNPMTSQQWYLDAYGVKELWNKPIINKARPVIAIIDTGVDITHPDLKDNIWTNQAEADGRDDYDNDRNGFKNDVHGWDFINNTSKMRDNNSHGTHVAGIAAAANNGLGIVGANPRALIMPVTVMQSDGTGDVATIVKGIDYAVRNGATVINMSIGTYGNSNALRQSLEKAYQSAVIVAAAGNDGRCIYFSHFGVKHFPPEPKPMACFPAAYSFVLGVQATTNSESLASFSNYDDDGPLSSCESTPQDPDGFNYELKAPGYLIYSTIPGGKYKELNGTSMASPLSAGAISALMMVKQYDSQEILWGDLLHSNNIADAYNISSRPAELDVMRVMLRDRKEFADESEEDFSDDQQIDVGETVKIFPVIRSSFGKASNIRLRLEVQAPLEVVTGEVDFGYKLDAFGRAVSKTPLVIKVPNNVSNASLMDMKIIATCNESDKPTDYSFKVRVNNMCTLKGLLTEDRTLTADHVYYVSSDLGINEGVTLTIEPGTRLEFAEDTGLYGFGKIVANGTPEKPIIFTGHNGEGVWKGVYSQPNNIISYCKMDGFAKPRYHSYTEPYMNDCVISPILLKSQSLYYVKGVRNVLTDISLSTIHWYPDLNYSNIVNCEGVPVEYSSLATNNYFNIFNSIGNISYLLRIVSNEIMTYKSDKPSYLGSAREDLLRPHIYEKGNTIGGDGYGWKTWATIDLSNMLKEPVKEAHGIVWKVLVNGKDAQDEHEQLPALGVGKHKFEVYFNRPMNKYVTPEISFGVISPYNQIPVAENGCWNNDGTIYTVYVTIDGKTQSDGMNRIYVRGAEDNEFFPCPYEATRFNIMIQAAGSMASGFQADAGLGCINLKWNNENNDFEDAMGFNVYRYTQGENNVNDTIRLNTDIIDISATSYVDDLVTPGITYYYYYKVLSTALQEYDISNVVAATPLTATRGDANGSGSVDVVDVITTVNYITGMSPKPFVFQAADMDSNQLIDIFDVVGIVQGILNPSLLATVSRDEATATYSIEDGTLYVESSAPLSGLQVQLVSEENQSITISEDLDGFETASAWLSDSDYLFMAYSMSNKTLAPGRHALLHIGDAKLASLRMCDTAGHKIAILEKGSNTTDVDSFRRNVVSGHGVYDLSGRKVTVSDKQNSLPHGVYIINGKKVVK